MDWDGMTFEEQLAWARKRLMELAEGAESEKVQAMSASALARSLEPKGTIQAEVAVVQTVPTVAALPAPARIAFAKVGMAKMKALEAEAEAELLESDHESDHSHKGESQ
jgi:hypothetical protein